MRNKSNISLATEIIKSEITALTRTLKRIDSSFDKARALPISPYNAFLPP
jgi:hypothetical protein